MLLVVGRIIRPHGVRGDLVCEVRTDEPEKRFVAGSVMRTDPAHHGPLSLTAVRWYQSRLLVTFAEVDDRNAADELRGLLLCVDSEVVDDLDDPDEFRDHELVGLEVADESGVVLGRVKRIDHAPAHELIVLNRESGGQAFIPFISQMVPSVDVAAGRIVVDLPEGMLDL